MPGEYYRDDHTGVPPESLLIRRINSQFCDWSRPDDMGRPRINSQAIQFYRPAQAQKLGCPGPAMSFHLESTPNSIDRLINDYPTYGLAQVSAAVIRLGGKLGAQPLAYG